MKKPIPLITLLAFSLLKITQAHATISFESPRSELGALKYETARPYQDQAQDMNQYGKDPKPRSKNESLFNQFYEKSFERTKDSKKTKESPKRSN